MKLIKAYIRTYMSDKTIHALEEIGAPRLTAIDIRALGDEVNPRHIEISAEHTGTYTEMVKLEIVADDENVKKIVDTILKNAKTGYQGDGIIIVSEVEEVFNVRTGETEEKSSK
jgi:nitrogen regulatory protein P-II 1